MQFKENIFNIGVEWRGKKCAFFNGKLVIGLSRKR